MRLPFRMRAAIWDFVAGRTVFARDPDVVIGTEEDPYMRRWWVVPRNKWFNVYFHNIRRSDDDRAIHDHPWMNLSVLLHGSYREVIPVDMDDPGGETVTLDRAEGQVIFRRSGRMSHRLMLQPGHDGGEVDVWTLFVTGPKTRDWGFWCGRRWVPWQTFTKPLGNSKSGAIGKGCGED